MVETIDISPEEVAKRKVAEEKRERELIDQDADIQGFMAELHGKGYQLGISRLSPSWCQGYLDTWPLDQPISLSEIRDAYGGKRFQLRILGPDGRYIVSRTVRIDGDPKRDGIPVTPGDVRRETAEANMIPMPMPQPAPPEGGGFLGELMGLLVRQMDGQSDFFKSLAAEKMAVADPMSTMKQTMEMMTMVKDLAGDMGGDEGMSGMAKIFMEEMVNKRQTQQQPALPPRRRPKRRPAPPPPTVAAQQQQQQQPVQNPEPADEFEEVELSTELADLGPEAAAEVIGETFNQWTPDQQRAAISAILADDELVSSLQPEGEIDNDEEEKEDGDGTDDDQSA